MKLVCYTETPTKADKSRQGRTRRGQALYEDPDKGKSEQGPDKLYTEYWARLTRADGVRPNSRQRLRQSQERTRHVQAPKRQTRADKEWTRSRGAARAYRGQPFAKAYRRTANSLRKSFLLDMLSICSDLGHRIWYPIYLLRPFLKWESLTVMLYSNYTSHSKQPKNMSSWTLETSHRLSSIHLLGPPASKKTMAHCAPERINSWKLKEKVTNTCAMLLASIAELSNWNSKQLLRPMKYPSRRPARCSFPWFCSSCG